MHRLVSIDLALACLLVTAPAFAGTVYVPYAADVTVNGVRYQTQIWAANRGAANRRIVTFFVAAGEDGTDRTGATFGGASVGPNASVLVTGVAPVGGVGLLEIGGAPQVVVSSRIVPVGGTGNDVGSSLPVISSENVLAASSQAHLQGLSRDTDLVSDFAIVNLASTAASCSVSFFSAAGAALGETSTVTVAPLSIHRAADFLANLNGGVINGVRATVSCNQLFYTYGVTFDAQNAAASVTRPSELLTSALNPPGGGGGTGECPSDATCFTRPGTFFTQVRPAVFHTEFFDVPPGTYRKVHFRVEVFHGGWGNLSGNGGLHSLFWLVRDRNFDLLGFSVFRKPDRNDVMFRHGIQQLATVKPKIFFPVEGIPGHTYAVDYTWNPGEHTLNYKLIDLTSGATVVDYVGVPNVNELTMAPGQRLRADFGFKEGLNENEDPGYGWSYSNATLEAFRE